MVISWYILPEITIFVIHYYHYYFEWGGFSNALQGLDQFSVYPSYSAFHLLMTDIMLEVEQELDAAVKCCTSLDDLNLGFWFCGKNKIINVFKLLLFHFLPFRAKYNIKLITKFGISKGDAFSNPKMWNWNCGRNRNGALGNKHLETLSQKAGDIC